MKTKETKLIAQIGDWIIYHVDDITGSYVTSGHINCTNPGNEDVCTVTDIVNGMRVIQLVWKEAQFNHYYKCYRCGHEVTDKVVDSLISLFKAVGGRIL